MKKYIAVVVVAAALGGATGAAAQAIIDRNRMANVRAQVKALALKLRDTPQDFTAQDRNDWMLRISYLVLAED